MAQRHHKIHRRWRGPTRQTQQFLQTLLALYQLLRTPQSLDTLLQAILDAAIECVPGVQRGSLVVREGSYFRFRALHGYDFEKLKDVRFPAEQLWNQLPEGQRGAQILSHEEWNSHYLEEQSYQLIQKYGEIHLIRRSLVSSIFVAGTFFGTLVLDNLHSYAPFPPSVEVAALLLAEHAGAVIEQAQLLDDLRRTHSLLAETEKLASLGRVVSGVAHEINNPLTAVLGYTDLLQLEDLSEDALQSLAHIRSGAERMRVVVRNLQVFARQQHHGQGEVDLLALVNQIVAIKQFDLAIDQIEVERELAIDLPLLWGDAGALSQVLLNLLSNAQQALRGQPGPRRLQIRAWLKPGTAQIGLSVSDNGPGIAPEVIGRIFEPFFTTRPPGQGSGLGLSVCYGIVAEHGGQIWAESQPGQGTTMQIELPVRQRPEGPGAGLAADAPRPEGLRVLLLDDDDLVVRLVCAALAPGNHVTIVRDGEAGLQLLACETFDVILCDLKMPGMNGSQFFQALRDRSPELLGRLMFISGDTSNLAAHDFLSQAGRPLLAKPFTPAELYHAINTLGAG